MGRRRSTKARETSIAPMPHTGETAVAESGEVGSSADFEIMARRARVAKLYARGKSLREIGKDVGLSAGHISRELKIIQDYWVKNCATDLMRRLVIEASKWDELEVAYWSAYEASCRYIKRSRELDIQSREIALRAKRLRELLELADLEDELIARRKNAKPGSRLYETPLLDLDPDKTREVVLSVMRKRSGLDKILAEANLSRPEEYAELAAQSLSVGLASGDEDYLEGDPKYLNGIATCVRERSSLFKLYDLDYSTGLPKDQLPPADENKNPQGSGMEERIEALMAGLIAGARAASGQHQPPPPLVVEVKNVAETELPSLPSFVDAVRDTGLDVNDDADSLDDHDDQSVDALPPESADAQQPQADLLERLTSELHHRADEAIAGEAAAISDDVTRMPPSPQASPWADIMAERAVSDPAIEPVVDESKEVTQGVAPEQQSPDDE